MKNDFKVFVGYDSAQPEAAHACRNSILAHDPDLEVEFVNKWVLIDRELYWRKDHQFESTEFSFTRFLVPYLKGYYGYALFCDSDFIWRCSPRELLEQTSYTDAVTVVKHDISPERLTEFKMDGKKQVWYPRKNWSSLMMFNCEHPETMRLTPATVSMAAASYLHGMEWAADFSIGEYDKTYNYLVGYYNDIENPKVIHFTDGTPLHPGYENCQFSEEFIKYVQR